MKKLLGLYFLILPLPGLADTVVPIESVDSYVNIRSAPDADSDVVGRLQRGIPLEHVDSVPGWHEVVVSEGQTGFVSAGWSVVIVPETVAEAPVEPEPAGEPDPITEPEPIAEPEAAEDSQPVAEVEPAPAKAPEPVAEVELEPAAEPEPVTEVEPEPPEAPAPAAAVEAESAPEPTAVAPAPEPVVMTGPPGPQGPPGPPGAATIEGKPGYLVRFKSPTVGESSQIYDDGNRVGIGTTEPAQRLEVNGSIQINEQNSSVAGLMITQSGGETGYIMHNRASTLTIGSGSVDRVTIDREGNLGIGVARPSQPLELANGAYVSAGGVWTNSSSKQDKENITSLTAEEALAALIQLEPVHYSYRDEAGEGYVGFIAEDVPDLVASSDRRGLSAMDVVAVLTRVIQVQQQRIENLESRLDALE